MKLYISFAVLLLLQNVSSSEVHRRHSHKSIVQQRLRSRSDDIHGVDAEDDASPHDPDVVDAPEDIKRVGNDHEELHNAKLAPNGYYNGFHHKDFEGNYVQKKTRSYDIHEVDSEDTASPHDPDVVDAPEDIKRVGNDHEDLHNAKLSPNGYYNGFHHKDFEGKYLHKSFSKQHRESKPNKEYFV